MPIIIVHSVYYYTVYIPSIATVPTNKFTIKNQEVFIRLPKGLLRPIQTTIGLKQGCGISPLLFNLFINRLPDIFDQTCDPVMVGSEKLSCLLWADDLVLLSSTPQGLQNSIDKTFDFYNEFINEMK